MRIPLNDLSGRCFDVAVIGAGINGCAAAQELAGGGYSVLLVDKGDFGAGSSSRSTRLLHCGLRYLAPGGSPYQWIVHPGKLLAAVSLTKAAMRAREEFVLNAPQRVRKMTFGFPVWKGMQYRPWHVDLGLRVVEAFASDPRNRLHDQHLPPPRSSNQRGEFLRSPDGRSIFHAEQQREQARGVIQTEYLARRSPN